MLIDSHCHLDFDSLSNQIEQIIKRADENDVQIMQTICTTIKNFPTIKKIAQDYHNIFCSVGVHPLNIHEDKVYSPEDIKELCSYEKVIGIGETGLDYHYDNTNKEKQKTSFINHIKAAQKTGLPLIIHTRDAEKDTIDILKESLQLAPFTAVIHCFTGSKNLAEECLKMGFYISASGIITFKNATDIQETFKTIPLDKILIETDSPYLAPVPKRGKTNEPSFVKYTAYHLAKLLDVDFSEIEKQTTANFFRLFSKSDLFLNKAK